MTGFLAEVGSKLADRWVALLAVPGLVYLTVATIAGTLGQTRSLDYVALGEQITRWAQSPTVRSSGFTVIIVAAIVAGSCMAGFIASILGELTEILWTAPGRRLPARWLSASRQKRSANAKKVADDPAATPQQVARAIAEADRICLVEASRPTWIGDRLRACGVRAQTAYGIDLAVAWPRLWLLLPPTVREEIGAVRVRCRSARLGRMGGPVPGPRDLVVARTSVSLPSGCSPYQRPPRNQQLGRPDRGSG